MKTLIMCGGSGTRLWPLSRTKCPKQFAPIIKDKSLFDMTLERNHKVTDEFLIVVNELQIEQCQKSLNSKYNHQLIIEPAARNTAAAIALACFNVDPEEVIFAVPSDHLISDDKTYYGVIEQASNFAKENFIVTFGIKARFPETGYGYIEAKGNEVLSFKEKPDLETASKYVSAGNFFWNSGMFCFKAGVYLSELKKHSPEVYDAIKKVYSSKSEDGNCFRFSKDLMMQTPSISVDYAVMEKSDKVKVVPSPITWSDMGSFDSLYDELDKDENDNTVEKNLILNSASGNLVIGGKRVIALTDVDDLIVIDTEDAILIGKRGKAQNVKQIVEMLKGIKPEVLD